MKTYENETGKFTPDEGVEAILKDFEEILKELKQFQTSPPSGEENIEAPKD